jgi:signal peptidase II
MSESLDASTAPHSDPSADSPSGMSESPKRRMRLVLFAILSAVSLALDLASKSWAEHALKRTGPFDGSITVIKDHLWFSLAYNKGGAWGLLHDAPDAVRRPFFVIVSVLAIIFIVSLYRKLHDSQWALKWGLPLVLGGALGNLMDRIVRKGVVDFIQYRADWVGTMNSIIHHVFSDWVVVAYWPTFNVADVAICIGVGLMAIDMFVAKKHPRPHVFEAVATQSQGEGSESH